MKNKNLAFYINKRSLIPLFVALISFVLLYSFSNQAYKNNNKVNAVFWKFQSIDTMKYSRDVSREKLDDYSFDSVIDQQVKNIAETGATHVAIGTPYDEEFLPILKRWVKAARKYDLNVWFRGNWSGWEGWFGYPKIDREQHIEKTKEFILKNRDLFENGDVLTACPECENGGPGDPRQNGDLLGHRRFLIEEYDVTKRTFKEIGKDVKSNYNSMNGDVARLVMDKDTTRKMDKIVVMDHYVAGTDQLVFDIKDIAQKSGGKVILGEFGAPIPDIHGDMTEEQQAVWVGEALKKLIKVEEFEGVNYWTSVGGSTELWNAQGKERKVVEKIREIFKPKTAWGRIVDQLGEPVYNAIIDNGERRTHSDKNGNFALAYIDSKLLSVSANGYNSKALKANEKMDIVIEREHTDMLFNIKKFIKDFIKNFSS